MKKVLIICISCLVVVVTSLTLFFIISIDNDDGHKHEHLFVEKIISDEYLLKNATCLERASFYYSCKCGKKGSDIFYYGETIEHNYVDGLCTYCKKKKPSDGLLYSTYGDYYEVSDVGTCKDVDIVVPSVYNGKEVKSIANGAFSNCNNIISVILPDVVTRIGSNAFSNCISLTSITIDSGIKKIDNNAFDGCTGLRSVKYTGSIDKWCCAIDFVNDTANPLYFAGKLYINDQLVTSVSLTDVEKISNNAFYNCTNISKIVIGEGIRNIGNCAFYNCTALKNIQIADGLKSVGNNAFENCPIEVAVVPTNACEQIANKNLKSVKITSGETIDFHAFYLCTNLNNVTLNEGLQNIGASAFYGCSSLKSITIPDSVVTLDDSAFENCDSLSDIKLGSNLTTIGERAFYSCNALNNIIIPDGVTQIGDNAFTYCNIESAEIPLSALPSVQSDKLRNLRITGGDTITAFYNCNNLISVSLPDEIMYIASGAFYNCPNLRYNENGGGSYLGNENNPYLALIKIKDRSITTFNIGDNTNVICDNVFDDCESLKKITVDERNDKYSAVDGVLYNKKKTEIVCVPRGIDGEIEIPDGITNLHDKVFYNCKNLSSVIISDSVLEIGGTVFSNCSGLTNIVFGNRVSSVGENAFKGCSKLKNVVINSNLQRIKASAFDGCNELTKVNYEGTVDGWAEINFANAKSNPLYYAKKLYISNNLISEANFSTATKISQYAFYNCENLLKITIGNSVKCIEDNAFYSCTQLAVVIINDGLEKIGNYAFCDCVSLSTVDLSKAVTNICKRAFSGCSELSKLNYAGTIEEWNRILKGIYWNSVTGEYEVCCTDGSISK